MTWPPFAAQLIRWTAKALPAPSLLHPSLRANTDVLEALGSTQVEAVCLECCSSTDMLECNRIACDFGLAPNTHLGHMLGCDTGVRSGLYVDALMR